jgi:transposase
MLQPNMRFVTRKSVEQQALLCLHRVRQGLIEERTASLNRLRGLLAEFGQVAPQSAPALYRALSVLLAAEDARLPAMVRRCTQDLREHVRAVEGRIAALDREIAQHAQGDESARRIAAVCGVVRTRPVPWSLPSATRVTIAMDGNSLLGWDWYRSNIQAPARPNWVASLNAAMPIYVRC